MDITMAGLAASEFSKYDLVNMATGAILYATCASEVEILKANANLRNAGFTSRFVKQGSHSMPSLHSVAA